MALCKNHGCVTRRARSTHTVLTIISRIKYRSASASQSSGEARFQDDVDRSADVDLIYLSVEGHADVLLLSVEQHGERGGPGGGVGGPEFPRGDAVVCAVLREEGGEVVVGEGAEICSERFSLERV